MVDVLLIAVVLVAVAASLFVGYLVGRVVTAKAKELEVAERLEEARQESVKLSRSALTGKFIEQLAPFLPEFPYDPTEVRFIGSPVDCLVFRGASREECDEVVFLEIKAGQGSLKTIQRRIRDAVKAGRVRWEEYRPEGGYSPSPIGMRTNGFTKAKEDERLLSGGDVMRQLAPEDEWAENLRTIATIEKDLEARARCLRLAERLSHRDLACDLCGDHLEEPRLWENVILVKNEFLVCRYCFMNGRFLLLCPRRWPRILAWASRIPTPVAAPLRLFSWLHSIDSCAVCHNPASIWAFGVRIENVDFHGRRYHRFCFDYERRKYEPKAVPDSRPFMIHDGAGSYLSLDTARWRVRKGMWPPRNDGAS